jgi:hypothetical protein
MIVGVMGRPDNNVFVLKPGHNTATPESRTQRTIRPLQLNSSVVNRGQMSSEVSTVRHAPQRIAVLQSEALLSSISCEVSLGT